MKRPRMSWNPFGGEGRAARGGAVVDVYRILFAVGMLILLLAVAMMPPMLIDLLSGNPDWQVFALSAVITSFAGLMMVLVSRDAATPVMHVREGFLLTLASWIAVSLFAALPYLLLQRGMGFAAAWFEAVSGLTTTGSTVLTGLDSMPPGILLWRSLTQWIGGIGIVVMALVMLPFLRIGGMQLFRTESSDRTDKLLPRARQYIGWLLAVYVTLTLLCALSYALAGMTTFDAVNHALTTISTGGFSTHDASMGHFRKPALHWLATLFMLASSLPLALYVRAVREGRPFVLFTDRQALGFLRITAGFVIALLWWRILWRQEEPFTAITEAAFNVAAIISTTGYALGDFTDWGPFAITAFFALMFLGGCTGSTAGGMKVFRLQIMLMAVHAHIRRLVRPHSIAPLKWQGRSVSPEIVVSVFAFVSVMFATVLLFSALIAATGVDFVTALSGSVTAVTNVGPGLGSLIGPSGNFAGLPEMAKVFLATAMLLGRLEFFTVLVVLLPGYWR